MDIARDVETGEPVHVFTLLQADRRQPGAWAQAKAERKWECLSCRGFAWMVKTPVNQSGHFAGHHPNDCPQDGREVKSVPGHVERRKKPVDNDGTTIQLRLETPAAPGNTVEVHADGSQPPGHGRQGQGVGDGERRESHTQTKSLGGLLGNLMTDEGYVERLAEVGRMIEVPERGVVRPESLIWSMDDLDPRNTGMMNRHVVAWGRVFSGNLQQRTGLGYLNQGRPETNKGAVVLSPPGCLSW